MRLFSVALVGKLLGIHETVASPKTALCFEEFTSPGQIFFSSPSRIVLFWKLRWRKCSIHLCWRMYFEGRSCCFARDELEQNFHPGNSDYQISHLEVIRWQYFKCFAYVSCLRRMAFTSPSQCLMAFRMVHLLRTHIRLTWNPPQCKPEVHRRQEQPSLFFPAPSCFLALLEWITVDSVAAVLKATWGQRLLLLGAAARCVDVLLGTCLLLGYHTVILLPPGMCPLQLSAAALTRERFPLSYSGKERRNKA